MSLHPKIVHFPVALLLSASLFALLALLFNKNRKVFLEVLQWNLIVGVLSAVITIISGLIAEKSLVHNKEIHEIMEWHESLAWIFSILFLISLVWLLLRKPKIKKPELMILTLLLIVSSGLLAYGAHLGGKMVYEEGAGVLPMEQYIQSENSHNHNDSKTYGNNEENHQNENTHEHEYEHEH